MVKEAYVSFEIAKLLKEKGFDEGCRSFYDYAQRLQFIETVIYDSELSEEDNECVAPTQQMAMRWLREVHNIKVNIFYNNSNYAIEYFELNTQTGVEESVFIGDGYDVYEQACEVAIKYCLENLI